MNRPLPAILAAIFIALPAAVAQVATVTTEEAIASAGGLQPECLAWEAVSEFSMGEGEFTVAHSVAKLPAAEGPYARYSHRDIIFKIELHYHQNAAGVRQDEDTELIWSRTHATWSEFPSRLIAPAVYDAEIIGDEFVVLYVIGSSTRADTVRRDGAGFVVRDTVEIVTQSDSGFNPRLLQSGTIIVDGGVVSFGFKALNSTHRLRGREHPYEFWRLYDGEAVEITDDDELWRLRVEHSHKLDDEDRPTLTKQIRRPGPEPDDSASPAKPDQQDPPVPQP